MSTNDTPIAQHIADLRPAVQRIANEGGNTMVIGWQQNDDTGEAELGYCPDFAVGRAFVYEVLETVPPRLASAQCERLATSASDRPYPTHALFVHAVTMHLRAHGLPDLNDDEVGALLIRPDEQVARVEARTKPSKAMRYYHALWVWKGEQAEKASRRG